MQEWLFLRAFCSLWVNRLLKGNLLPSLSTLELRGAQPRACYVTILLTPGPNVVRPAASPASEATAVHFDLWLSKSAALSSTPREAATRHSRADQSRVSYSTRKGRVTRDVQCVERRCGICMRFAHPQQERMTGGRQVKKSKRHTIPAPAHLRSRGRTHWQASQAPRAAGRKGPPQLAAARKRAAAPAVVHARAARSTASCNALLARPPLLPAIQS
jgi:hypothetical protein